MPLRLPTMVVAALVVATLAASPLTARAAPPPVPTADPAAPGLEPAPAGTRAAPAVRLDWTRTVVAGRSISTSSPVVVENQGNPFVAVGDVGGNLRAYDLDSGAPVPGWGSVNTGFQVRAPLSTDGRNVYVPVAQDGKDRFPQYKRFGPNGALAWSSNPGTAYPASGGFLLSGLSLALVDGAWRGFGGSSGHWFYGVDGGTGAQRWGFRNADSTMATPAVADLYGAGRPQVITSNDTSAEDAGDRHGGILRILTADGKQVCTATQLVSGTTYASSGYNNASPAVAEVGGQPLIVLGSTGPTQTGPGGNQVVAYDAACGLRWASPALAGQAAPSPTFADVLGTGTPQVVQVVAIPDGAARYPRVYVLDAATGRVRADTGSSLRTYGANVAYPSSTSIATADVNGDGAQDLFVPARQGRFLVLDGRTRAVLTTIPTNLATQNTPVITQEPDGVRVTLAGYAASGGIVSSYVITGGALGARGWHRFGADPQLTGLQGSLSGPYNQLIEGQVLRAGGRLRSANGSHTATMQADGNLVLRDAAGTTRWSTGTDRAGSVLTVRPDGELQVIGPDLSLRWRSGATGVGAERLVLGTDGALKIYSGTWSGTRRLNATRSIWSSATDVVPVGDRIGRGQSLRAGQSLTSKDGTRRVTMQPDGNLVLYRGSKLLWQSLTRDLTGQGQVTLRADGNLVITGANGRVLKDYGLAGRGGVLFVVQSDGILRVADSWGRSVWQTNTLGR